MDDLLNYLATAVPPWKPNRDGTWSREWEIEGVTVTDTLTIGRSATLPGYAKQITINLSVDK
jgi:hypothetical protein